MASYPTVRSLLLCLVPWLVVAVSPLVAADTPTNPTLWPEAQRSFFQDGPGLLLSSEQRTRLLALDERGRQALIDEFLAADPIPETPENELTEGIRRRTLLARASYLSPRDVRYRLLFVSGKPTSRQRIDCGLAFKPLEIWRYSPAGLAGRRAIEAQSVLEPEVRREVQEKGKRGRELPPWVESPQVVLYLPSPGAPYRIWEPFDSKRALYSSKMEYYLRQAQEIWESGRRFDRQACKEADLVDRATGIEALWGYSKERPTRGAIGTFVAPPPDLEAWAREAATTVVPEAKAALTPVLGAEALSVHFPRKRRQRLVTRFLVTLPPEIQLQADDKGKYRITMEGVVESAGKVFEDFRVRFELDSDALTRPVPLAADRLLRPSSSFVIRLRVRDEISGALGYLTAGFAVPREPREEDAETAVEAMVGEVDETATALEGPDALLLVPVPQGEVTLGLFRAEALVSGDRIAKVTFLVDGVQQLIRARPPFTAEVRLAERPREQVVRAEGYDSDGELVAADELNLNQPRGAFRVTIVQPAVGDKSVGEVSVRAEVVVPDERRIQEVEIQLDGETVATLSRPPWTTTLQVPENGEFSYLTVVARLDDDRWVEAVRVLNSPNELEELNVRLVELYTTVTDRGHGLVRGLTEEDFEIYEEGVRQKITKFELVENLPLTVAVTIDTSGSMTSSLVEAQRAGQAFLADVLTPRDRCLVVGFAGKPILRMPPTSDLESCSLGLEGLIAEGWTALHDAVVTSLYHMRELTGQRALVLLSDGDDTVSSVGFSDALEYARRSGVVIYTIGLDVSALSLDVRRKLANLATETGGRTFYIHKADELGGVYDEIERELRSRYLVAYSPQSGGEEDEFREVEVKTRRRGLRTRTIRGYYP